MTEVELIIELGEIETLKLSVLNLQLHNLALQGECLRNKTKEVSQNLQAQINACYELHGVTKEEYDLSPCGKKLTQKKTVNN